MAKQSEQTQLKKEDKGKKTKKSGSTALKVAGGLLAGAAAGAIAGILLAPDSGKNTRKKIADKTKKITASVKEKAVKKIKGLANRIESKPKGKKK